MNFRSAWCAIRSLTLVFDPWIVYLGFWTQIRRGGDRDYAMYVVVGRKVTVFAR